jgi:regulatory protein
MRPRGRAELERALSEKGFSDGAVRAAIEKLADQGFLDDVAAARSAVRARGARYGRSRVERELRARGFEREAIDEAFAAEGGTEREDEALRKAFERLWRERGDLAPRLRRRRVFDALTRRGFSAERISDIIRKGHEID